MIEKTLGVIFFIYESLVFWFLVSCSLVVEKFEKKEQGIFFLKEERVNKKKGGERGGGP